MRYLLDHEGVDINFIDEILVMLHYAAYGSREEQNISKPLSFF